jgi:hypothetical protein
MARLARTALVFPPHWYYASVPADLLDTGSFLRAAGVPVETFDLSAGLSAALLGKNPGYLAFRQRDTYGDDSRYRDADRFLRTGWEMLGATHGVVASFYRLELTGVDAAHVPSTLEVALDPGRNPAARLYAELAIPAILANDPELVAVALVHPDQIAQVPAFGRMLRRAGYRGFLVIYGAHEDVVSPEDLVEDLAGDPPHVLFEDYDGAIIGEAESALAALAAAVTGGRELAGVPGLLAPRHGLGAPPRTAAEDVTRLPPLDLSLVDPSLYPYPAPVIDLRVSRSCPWGRCTFCAITTHQAGYRARPTDTAVADMRAAHAALGSTFFRFRDDLLTPEQLGELARALPSLPFRPRWSARARFENGFSRDLLRAAAAAGLEELWLGLESAVPRVRTLMVKGIAQGVAERILCDCEEAGIRVRALCILGYPGETLAEARATLDFLEQHMFRVTTVSLTPFQLMRNTPLGRDPARHGITLSPDPLPRHERLRHMVDGAWQGVQPEEIQGLMREADAQLGGWIGAGSRGPTLTHAWMRASVERAGWT